MNKLFIDSSAWIEYLSGTEKGKKVRALITKPEVALFTTGLIVAEVSTHVLKQSQSVDQAVAVIQSLASLVSFDFTLGKSTALRYLQRRKTHGKFGLADAHALAVAQFIQGKVLTCDLDFLGLAEAIVIR